MATSQAWIDALLARQAPSSREARDLWTRWLSGRPLHLSALKAEPVVALMAQRPLRTPLRAAGDVRGWRLLTALWRTDTAPRSREDQRLHRQGMALTALAHVLLAAFWLWLTWVHIPGPLPAPAGNHVVQVEYIGDGTPQQTGGGEPAQTPAQTQVELLEQPPQQPPPAPGPSSAPAQAVAQSQPTVTEPAQIPPPPAPQPLQVSEVAEPSTSFVLPPTTLPELRSAQSPSDQQVIVQPRQITLEEPQALPQVQLRPLQPSAQTPTPPVIQPQVRQRDVAMEQPVTLPQVRAPALATSPTLAPQANANTQVRQRDVALNPAPAAATAAAPGSASAAAAQPAASATDAATPANAASAGTAAAATSGVGPKPAASAGAWPAPKRGDDWGEGNRQRAGDALGEYGGLHGRDGRPNLPAGMAQSGGGLPPGTDTWTREHFDRNGTWLKRPPLDYRASRFEQYWRPHETLLEEWVRRGIKQMQIPLPGTSKRITCVVSVLQLGGGCGITDPDINDQEAIARPPPDIPFKPELAEDQDALQKPPEPL